MTRFLSLLVLAAFVALGSTTADAQAPPRIELADAELIPPTVDFERLLRRSAPAAVGSWDSTYGTLTMIQREDGRYIGNYDTYGRINGRMNGNTMTGTFFHPNNSGACPDARQGSTNWGKFEFNFAGDGSSFTGKWNWCGRDLTHTWDASKM